MQTKNDVSRSATAMSADVEVTAITTVITPHLRLRRGEIAMMVTVAHASWMIAPGKLTAAAIEKPLRFVQKRLRKIEGHRASVAACEVAFNVVNNSGGWWSPHLHMVTVVKATDFDAAKKLLQNVFRGQNDRAKGLYRTIVVKEVTDLSGALRYLLKSAEPASVVRRSIWDGEDGRRHTKKQALTKSQRSEYDRALGHLSLNQRLTRVGFSISGGGVVGTPKPKKAKKRGAVNSGREGELVRSGVRKSSKKTVKSEG